MIEIDKAKELWPSTCHGRWMSEEYEPGLVSVIIPTYNRAHMVTEAMDSVWAQTYRPIELIVVDDGSTDNTREVVEEWGSRHADDPQFTLRYFYEENRGAPAARNLGLIESRGEFIQFLDSDDLLLPEKLSSAIDQFRSDPKVDLVYALWQYQDRRGHTTLPQAIPDLENNPTPGETAIRNLCTFAAVYRRGLIRLAGPWNEELLCWQEWEWHARMMVQLHSALHSARRVGRVLVIGRLDRCDRIGTMVGARRFDADWIKSQVQAVRQVYGAVMLDRDTQEALSCLASRYLSAVRRAIAGGAPRFCRELVLTTPRIWKHRGARGWFEAVCWYVVSLLLGWLCGPILRRLVLWKRRLLSGNSGSVKPSKQFGQTTHD